MTKANVLSFWRKNLIVWRFFFFFLTKACNLQLISPPLGIGLLQKNQGVLCLLCQEAQMKDAVLESHSELPQGGREAPQTLVFPYSSCKDWQTMI